MAALLVCYKTPVDTSAFDRHYETVHIPLAKTIPGVRKYEISKGPILTPRGAAPYHLIAVIHFDDLATLKASMASPEGRAAGADVATFATGGVDMFMFETGGV